MHTYTPYLAAAAMTLSAITTVAAPAAHNVRQVNDTSFDNPSFIAPESFETDVHKLMQNWYLRNYTQMDREADKRASVNATDQDYIDRLQHMNTVIEMPYNRLVRSFINMYVERKKGLVESMLGMSLYYMPIFEQALDRHGMPMELKYLPVIESALNPNAVSRAGATGLWQFMTDTAIGEGLEVNSVVDERRDPYRSSDAAARYLKKLYGIYNDWSLAIAAYNCGPGNVNKALRRAGGGKRDFWEIYRFLPAETRDYIPAFIAANYALNYYDKHNISPALAARPIITDTVHVSRRVHFEQISEVLDIPMDEIRILNPQYRTDLIPGDVKPYPLVLPNLQVYSYIANEDSIVNHNAEKYARRDVVEPSTSDAKSKDNKGEYVEELVVKYHKVRRGETLSSIARRYGVTTSSIRKANNIGKSVRRGQTLKINTYTRRYVPSATPADTTATAAGTTTDSVATNVSAPVANVDSTSNVTPTQAETKPVEQPKKPEKAVKKEKPAEPTKHTIKSGENLSKIAAKYGISVDELKKANNLKNDNIQAGQTLTIPQKAAKKKSSRRRKR